MFSSLLFRKVQLSVCEIYCCLCYLSIDCLPSSGMLTFKFFLVSVVIICMSPNHFACHLLFCNIHYLLYLSIRLWIVVVPIYLANQSSVIPHVDNYPIGHKNIIFPKQKKNFYTFVSTYCSKTRKQTVVNLQLANLTTETPALNGPTNDHSKFKNVNRSTLAWGIPIHYNA